jgi:hypothetical protein
MTDIALVGIGFRCRYIDDPPQNATNIAKADRHTLFQCIEGCPNIMAREMIANSVASIGHVASRLGYATTVLFASALRTSFGMRPLQWRNGCCSEPLDLIRPITAEILEAADQNLPNMFRNGP